MATMRTNPLFENNKALGAGMFGTPNGGFRYDLNRDVDVPSVGDFGATANRNKLEAVYDEINGVYDDLIKSGKRSQAFALRDAADKFRRAGAKYGVNSFRRVRALKDLENSINVASQGSRARIMQQRLGDLRGTIGQLSQMSNTAFNQAMQRANFREQKLASLRNANKRIGGTSRLRSPITRQGRTQSPIARDPVRDYNRMLQAKQLDDTQTRLNKMQGLTHFFDREKQNADLVSRGRPLHNPYTSALMAYYGGGETGVAKQASPINPIRLPVYPGGARQTTPLRQPAGTGQGQVPGQDQGSEAYSRIAARRGIGTRRAGNRGINIPPEPRISPLRGQGQRAFTFDSPTTIGSYQRDPKTGGKRLWASRRTG